MTPPPAEHQRLPLALFLPDTLADETKVPETKQPEIKLPETMAPDICLDASCLPDAINQAWDYLGEHPGACVELRWRADVSTKEQSSAEPSSPEESSALSPQQQLSLLLMDSRQAMMARRHPHARLYATARPTQGSVKSTDSISTDKNSADTPARDELPRLCASGTNAFLLLWQLCHSLAARDLPPADVMPAASNKVPSPVFSGHYWFCEPGHRRELHLRLEQSGDNANARECNGPELTLTLTQGSATLPARAMTGYWCEFEAADSSQLAGQLQQTLHSASDKNTEQYKLATSADSEVDQPLVNSNKNAYRAVVVAATQAQLISELQTLLSHIQGKSTVWLQTPAGSCYCPAHQSVAEGELAFIYPGVGTIWAGMYQGLHLYFPTLFESCQHLPLRQMLQADTLGYQASKPPFTQGPLINQAVIKATGRQQVTSSPHTLAQQAVAGVGQSWLLTQLLTREFDVKPDMAAGYSMGEISMWASLGIWRQPESLIQPTLDSSIFNLELSGPLHAVKALWQWQQSSDKESSSNELPDWGCYLLKANSELVQQQIDIRFGKSSRLYIPIRHYDSCILAGDKQQADAIVAALKCTAIASPLITAMHTPASWHLHERLQAFYLREIAPTAETDTDCAFFSASQPLPLSAKTPDLSRKIAASIAETLCEPLNFPALISKVTRQGARVLLEVGADRQLTSLLGKQKLSWQPIKTLACNSKGAAPHISLLKCLTALKALGLNIKAPLAENPRWQQQQTGQNSNITHLPEPPIPNNAGVEPLPAQAQQEEPHVISR